MPEPVSLLTLQFLDWVARRPRTYAEAMEAWRTSCPRLSVWEDALLGGLIQVVGDGPMRQGRVELTPRGRAVLDGNPVPGSAHASPVDVGESAAGSDPGGT
jgi:hypothetical protein